MAVIAGNLVLQKGRHLHWKVECHQVPCKVQAFQLEFPSPATTGDASY